MTTTAFDAVKLMSLLPAIYRLRDGELAQQLGVKDGPLAALLGVMAQQIAVIEEDLEQLQDDAFIETCATWAIPYIGDLIGYRPLHTVPDAAVNARAEVAHTIAYRRRKGTATVLEQLARDVTGWNAAVVEYFQRVITTQYMNHPRPWLHAAPDLRQWQPLVRVGGAFDTTPRSIDVRRIASGRGRHNIPNIGVFLWALDAHALHASPAIALDARRFRFSPLGNDVPLVTQPQTQADITELATPLNVPQRIERRVMDATPADFYSDATAQRSLRLYVGTAEPLPAIDVSKICVCHLGDEGATWAHLPPAGKYAIDPVLGRIALPPGLAAGTRVRVDFHHAFGANAGGGEYERAASFADVDTTPPVRVPQDHATIQAALTALGGQGVIEISDSGRYAETLSIDVAANGRIELRAANGHRPSLVLTGEMLLRGAAGAKISLNGLLISGDRLRVPAGGGNRLTQLQLRHCTLVPGRSLDGSGAPQSPTAASLIVETADTIVHAEHCILGALRAVDGAQVTLSDSALDATAIAGVAYAALDGVAAGGALSLIACTVVGKIHALALPLVSNSLLLAQLAAADTWHAPILSERRQSGCVRYSYLPDSARVPRRYRCVPGDDTTLTPVLRLASLHYGQAVYLQLGATASAEIRSGADDEGEMGFYHQVGRPQREANLRLRLDEYLRVGLEAGVFYQT